MNRLFALSFALLLAGLFCLAQEPRAQVPMTGAGLGAPGGAPFQPFQLDGSVSANNAVWPSTGQAVTLTTIQTQGLIVVAILTNAASVTSVTATGLTFTLRTNSVTTGGGSYMSDYTAPYSGGQCNSGCAITVSPASTNFTTATAFGISGDKSGSPFDGNASVPAASSSGIPAITTSNANNFIFTNLINGGGGSCTAGSGWSLINGSNFQCVEYQIFTSTQTSLTPTQATGTSTGGLVDAVQKGP
jgi:hypothetical protein